MGTAPACACTHEAPMGARTLKEPKEPACAHTSMKHPKHPWVHTPQGAPLPRKGTAEALPPAPPPRRSVGLPRRGAGFRPCRCTGGLRAAVGGRGPRQVGAAGLCLPPAPRPLPALPSLPVPSSVGPGGPFPWEEPRGCPGMGTSSGPGPQALGWLWSQATSPFVTRAIVARGRRWLWEGAGALQELLWL